MKTFQVQPEQDTMRLDQFLARALGGSRKKAKQLIDEGRIFLADRKVIIASWQVAAGETWTVRDPGETAVPRRERYLKVYFEDPDILVVEKPPGVACERTAQTLTSTLVDDINDYLRRAHPEIEYPYVGLMHRLDRETSGVMVYTLSRRANSLSDQFKRHTVVRRYLALVEGPVKKMEGTIDSVLVKDLEARGKKMKALGGGKGRQEGRAVTHFQVIERYPNATLVEARLETGRTHQVRVHLASLGHPVIGDKLYGSKIPAPRHALHASYLEFRHPISNKKIHFKSKPPKDFQKLMENLRAKSAGLKGRFK
ncbi:MAG: RluA family pseudouridine synthase [bacterium]